MKKILLLGLVIGGCGGASTYSPVPTPQPVPDAIVSGQYNLVLTSTSGHGTINIYTDFKQTGKTLKGAPTLVCPLNVVSQCQGNDPFVAAIIPTGTVSGANITITVSFPTGLGADTVSMVGAATASKSLTGTYTDSLGDTGTWIASTAIHPIPFRPAVDDYIGSFNSTANPLLIDPTISVEVGQSANSTLTGSASLINFPCISSLTLSGQAIGDALSLTDETSKAVIIALPSQPATPTGNNFIFLYRFEPTAASCAGDFGQGVLTIATSDPWGY
jgi:hypothetical protein